MNGNQIQDTLARAQSMILSEDFNKKVNARSKSVVMDGGPMVSSGADLRAFEEMAFGDGGGSMNNNYSQQQLMEEYKMQQLPQQQQLNLENSKLPKAILESFKKTPPITIEDNSVMEQVTRNLSQNAKKIMREQALSTPQQVVTTATPQIDYSLIKTIINEAIRSQLEDIKHSLLTESTTAPQFKGMKIGDGNKIQFLDNKGNLYEGVLKLKKKAN